MSGVNLASLRALAESWTDRSGNDALPSGPRYGTLAEQEELANGVLTLVEAVEAALRFSVAWELGPPQDERAEKILLDAALAPFRQEQP